MSSVRGASYLSAGLFFQSLMLSNAMKLDGVREPASS